MLITFLQKKKTRVLVRLLGQQIQHEMHPKSTKLLSFHLPVCVCMCTWRSPSGYRLCAFIHVILHSHLCLYMDVHICPENSEMQYTTSRGDDQDRVIAPEPFLYACKIPGTEAGGRWARGRTGNTDKCPCSIGKCYSKMKDTRPRATGREKRE